MKKQKQKTETRGRKKAKKSEAKTPHLVRLAPKALSNIKKLKGTSLSDKLNLKFK